MGYGLGLSTATCRSPCAPGEQGISRFSRKKVPRSLGVSRPRRIDLGLALTAPIVLPAALATASASGNKLFHGSIPKLACTPVNASTPPSRAAPHDSGPSWFAIPSMWGSFILSFLPVYPGALPASWHWLLQWGTGEERSVAARSWARPPSWVKEVVPPMDSGHSSSPLPHHRLRAYGTALAFLRAVQDARIRDRELRAQALRSAKSVCLNIAEGAGRVTRADKARAYTVARGELVEAIAAVEIAHESGDALREAVSRVLALGAALYAVLTKLVH